MANADHTNENGQHCCPFCLESHEYSKGGTDALEKVECKSCGSEFAAWTEYRPQQCSTTLNDLEPEELEAMGESHGLD